MYHRYSRVGIEPVAGHRGIRTADRGGRHLGPEPADDGLHVTGRHLTGIGPAPIDDQLDGRWRAAVEVAREALGDVDGGDGCAGVDQLAQFSRAVHRQQPGDEGRRREARAELLRPAPAVPVIDRDIHVAHLEGGGEGEDQQLHQRREDQHDPAARVAHDAQQLLHDLRAQARGEQGHRQVSRLLRDLSRLRASSTAPIASIARMSGMNTDHTSPAR